MKEKERGTERDGEREREREKEEREKGRGSCHYANLRPGYNRREEFYAFCCWGVRS